MADISINSTKFWTRTAILLAAALAFQMGGFPQPVTGPAVNAVLIIAVGLIGPLAAVIIGAFTPIIAFIRGILPPPLGPMIPAIVFGNALYAIIFFFISWSRKRTKPATAKIKVFSISTILAVIVGALAKFFILAWAVNFMVQVPEPIAQMMTLPQLYTALVGGGIALLVLKALPDSLKVDSKIF
ncbi:ECF transporter S component [Halanaerobiaceae bacterium Z-7014]|uniref:ECF transporter S component n=1 Tax=Halonatronomonas betaini TaxID=2778430 RepID=A0A931F6Z3_9FIRM|nr:ECF transporter S component [Halonatronomonas betaini]MBF8437440.1 ECF transporter S component [Halonatronomonas betaini]